MGWAVMSNLIGKTFGRLTVVSVARQGRRLMAHCRCECGAERDVRAEQLPSGKSKSCGCLSRELSAERGHQYATHGHSNTRVYTVWRGMMTRCYNDKHDTYQKYGARGIRVCDRWKTFENFLADMGEKPAGMTIERINNDGNYELGNCRWATPAEQARNRRSSRFITYKGASLTIAEWAERMGVKVHVLDNRLRRSWPLDRVFSSPCRDDHEGRSGHEQEAAGLQ
jgi:hypothetical protein